MKRTPLRRVSKKQAKRLEEYRKLRVQFLHDNRMCEAGLVFAANGIDTDCTKLATEIHHKARRGKNLNNPDTFCPTCRHCHTFCHENPKIARELGLFQSTP